MKIEKIQNALDVIELLLNFKPDQTTISPGQLRSHFKGRVLPHTVDDRINSLFNQGLVETLHKKDIGKKITSGGDKNEHRITTKGIVKRKEIINHAIKILKEEIDQIFIKKTTIKGL